MTKDRRTIVLKRPSRDVWVERRHCPVRGQPIRLVLHRGTARCPACGQRIYNGQHE